MDSKLDTIRIAERERLFDFLLLGMRKYYVYVKLSISTSRQKYPYFGLQKPKIVVFLTNWSFCYGSVKCVG